MSARFRLLMLAAIPLVVVGLACGGDDDADTDANPTATTADAASTPAGSPTSDASAGGDDAIEQAVRDLVEAYNSADPETFFAAMTDDGAASFLQAFGLPTDDLEGAKQAAAPFIGEQPLTPTDLNVAESSEDSATVELISETGNVLEGDRLSLVQEDGTWKVDLFEVYVVSPDVPSDYETVDVEMTEFNFGLASETLAAGNIAFDLENAGEQPHEAVLARLDEDVVLEDALQATDQPEGIEIIGGVFNIAPGESYNMVVTDELPAGRYALVCFLPNLEEGPEGTPHAFLGMAQEFTIE